MLEVPQNLTYNNCMMNERYELTDALEQLDFIRESTSEEFRNEKLAEELIRWMGPEDAQKALYYICRCWDIETPWTHDAEVIEVPGYPDV